MASRSSFNTANQLQIDIEKDKIKNARATFSMDIDSDTAERKRTYPSQQDYYLAHNKNEDPDAPVNLEPGLSNYSSLKLGDDRISFSESVLSATFRLPVEDLMGIPSPSRSKTQHSRKREYQDALVKVGETELNRLERVMKDKLFQRSYETSSPFQVRKAFKFFDRELSLRIPIEGFTCALEFLGFQFSDIQNLALFARYDPEYVGTIDYMRFISDAMFYAAVEPDFGQTNFAPAVKECKDETETKKPDPSLERSRIKATFDMVARNDEGEIDADELDVLMMSLGYKLKTAEIESCKKDILGGEGTGKITFQLFHEWLTDSMGAAMINGRK